MKDRCTSKVAYNVSGVAVSTGIWKTQLQLLSVED
jgi:hypothetical protein